MVWCTLVEDNGVRSVVVRFFHCLKSGVSLLPVFFSPRLKKEWRADSFFFSLL